MRENQRNMAKKLQQLLTLFPIVAILGARQVGKSTLAKQCCPDWRYIDLERPDDFEQISNDPLFYFEQFPDSVIIDEAQIYPDLFKVLRGVIDNKRQQKGRFILTGSSNPELLAHLSESLAGRIAIIELGTLKANEYYATELSPFYDVFNQPLDKKYLPTGTPPLSNEHMHHVWWQGGYPEPLLANDAAYHAQWMEQYRNTYINRDIARLFPRLNKFSYQRFLSIVSTLSGTILNKSDIARNMEVNEKTIREYLQIVDGTFIWRQLPSYEKNVMKSVIKMPKGHVRDTGLLHFLLRLNSFDDLFQSNYIGHSFEAFVIEELLKGLNASMITNWQPYYYRTRAGAEIDLILEGNFGVLPIEIKHSTYVMHKQLKALTQFIDEHDVPFGMVINQSKEVLWLTPKIIQIPVGWL